ncbi:MAG TPA: hypothetical protein VFT39_10530 [Vicinamibacterales bacterium]|nr:hypothetical protein [Vicinamibacterales bacterium]
MEWTSSAVERHTSAPKSVGQHIVCERHDLVSGGMNITMHIADEMANTRRLGEVTRMHDKDVLICGADKISGFGVVVKKLSRMKNRTRWQFEREHHAVRRFNETPDSTTIQRAHRQLDDRQAGRRLTMRMKDAHRNWGGRRRHML